jgi:hypothetical protein
MGRKRYRNVTLAKGKGNLWIRQFKAGLMQLLERHKTVGQRILGCCLVFWGSYRPLLAALPPGDTHLLLLH